MRNVMANPTTNLFRLFSLLFPGDRRRSAYPKTGKRIGECSICSSPLNSNPRQINTAKIPETIIYLLKPVYGQSMRLIKTSRAVRASSTKSTVTYLWENPQEPSSFPSQRIWNPSSSLPLFSLPSMPLFQASIRMVVTIPHFLFPLSPLSLL